MKTVYSSTSDLTGLQQEIMHVIIDWIHKKNTPIPLKQIMITMKDKGVKDPTIVNSVNGLLLKGYLRRACIISNRTFFVMMRSI